MACPATEAWNWSAANSAASPREGGLRGPAGLGLDRPSPGFAHPRTHPVEDGRPPRQQGPQQRREPGDGPQVAHPDQHHRPGSLLQPAHDLLQQRREAPRRDRPDDIVAPDAHHGDVRLQSHRRLQRPGEDVGGQRASHPERPQIHAVPIAVGAGDAAQPGVVEIGDAGGGQRRVAYGHDPQGRKRGIPKAARDVLVREGGQVRAVHGPPQLPRQDAGAEQRGARDGGQDGSGGAHGPHRRTGLTAAGRASPPCRYSDRRPPRLSRSTDSRSPGLVPLPEEARRLILRRGPKRRGCVAGPSVARSAGL